MVDSSEKNSPRLPPLDGVMSIIERGVFYVYNVTYNMKSWTVSAPPPIERCMDELSRFLFAKRRKISVEM